LRAVSIDTPSVSPISRNNIPEGAQLNRSLHLSRVERLPRPQYAGPVEVPAHSVSMHLKLPSQFDRADATGIRGK
jgi:hypothetical protein